MAALALESVVKLSSGYTMPLLGFGVYQNYDTKASVLEAFKAGYRYSSSCVGLQSDRHRDSDISILLKYIVMKLTLGLQYMNLAYPEKNCLSVVSKNHGYEKTLSGVDESLKKFGFDYIDLFLIHDPFSGKDLRLATWKALIDARNAGKIRSIGVSNFSNKHLEEIRDHGLEMPSVNQIELHPFCQQKPIVEYCRKHAIVVQAYCPILRGKMDHEVIQEIAKKHARDPAQILIRWSLQRGFVPLPKSATPERIHSNAQVYDFLLNEDDMKKLDSLDRGAEGAISWNPVGAP